MGVRLTLRGFAPHAVVCELLLLTGETEASEREREREDGILPRFQRRHDAREEHTQRNAAESHP